MKNKELNEKQIEQLVQEAMPEVGRRYDDEIVDALKGTTKEQLMQILEEVKKKEPAETLVSDKPIDIDDLDKENDGTTPTAATPKKKNYVMTFLRLAAACAVLVLIIVAIERMDFGTTSQKGNATLYNTYYKEYVSKETFSANGDVKNPYGKANTAKIIQDASKLINDKHSRRALHNGIRRLERLLAENNFRPDLEHEIHWYLGLGYLKDNRVAKAREEFQKVIYLKSPHSADAKELLEKTK